MEFNNTAENIHCSNCSLDNERFMFQISDFPKDLAFPIYGVLTPIVTILTLITNILVVCVFMKRRMRSVTTVFLVGLAVSDTLGAFLWSCVHLFFYGIRQKPYTEPISYPLCVFHDYGLYIAVILHTISVWLTMTLGIQRCIIVVFPFKGPRIWTMKNSVIMTTMSYLIAIVFFIFLFFMKDYSVKEMADGSQICMESYADWFNRNISTYMSIYHVLRSVAVQLLPCLSMMVSTAVLAHKLRNEKIFQRGMSKKIGVGQKKDYQHRHRTTLMVVIIMIIFLIVEVPNGIVFAIKIYDPDNTIMPTSIDYPFAILHNFILLLSYHCNFWIYVGLSARFRRTLKDMLLVSRVKRTFERVMSMSRTDSFSHQGYPLSTMKNRHINGNGSTVVKYTTVCSEGYNQTH